MIFLLKMTLLLIALKLFGFIAVSWLIVFAPAIVATMIVAWLVYTILYASSEKP